MGTCREVGGVFDLSSSEEVMLKTTPLTFVAPINKHLVH